MEQHNSNGLFSNNFSWLTNSHMALPSVPFLSTRIDSPYNFTYNSNSTFIPNSQINYNTQQSFSNFNSSYISKDSRINSPFNSQIESNNSKDSF